MRKGIRGKSKIQNCYTERDMYDDYVKDKPVDSEYYVTSKQYYDLCKLFYEAITDYILESAGAFKMPFGLGELRIIKRKQSLRPMVKEEGYYDPSGVNWELTKKYGKYIYYINEHSRGFKYRFHWHKYDNSLKNKFLYRLVMTRQIKRRLAKMIKSGEYDYTELKSRRTA